MKAFLFAAGIGSRLQPLTDHTPKCMLPIGRTPLLDLWLDTLQRADVDEVLINLHHLPHVVATHLSARRGPPSIRLAYEPELLGSAGTLRHHSDWIRDEDFFLALNADNLTDFDLRRLIDYHRAGHVEATLTVFRVAQPSQFGIVEVDHSGLVTSFTEKPTDPKGDLANAGMYAFNPSVIQDIDDTTPSDVGYQLLPRLIGRARALPVQTYFRDIGTPAAYHLALQEWQLRVAS